MGFIQAFCSENMLKERRTKRRISLIFVGSIYPWRVAPQQSPLPFQLNIAKNLTNHYIYKLSKKASTFTWTDNYYAKSLSLDFWTGTIAGTFFILVEGLRLKMKCIWLYLFLTVCIAYAFGFPLFLFMRELQLRGQQ
jgi:hypothetical protein